jgi:hypothetical protein
MALSTTRVMTDRMAHGSPVKPDVFTVAHQDFLTPGLFSFSKNLAMDDNSTNRQGTKNIVLHILSFLIMRAIQANGEKIISPSKSEIVSSVTTGTWTL